MKNDTSRSILLPEASPSTDSGILPGERLDTVNEQIRLIQKTRGLTFGTDAFLLASYVRPEPHSRAVELGAGSGIVSLLLTSKNKISSITAVEIQRDYADLIARNARLNALSDRVKALEADLRGLKVSDVGGEVPLVVSNPPYMPVNAGKRNETEWKYIARHETAGNILDFCLCASTLLRDRGRFVTVWRPDRLAELMAGLAAAKMAPKRMTFVHADADTPPSMVLTEAVKGGKNSLTVTEPLLLYERPVPGEVTRTRTPQCEEVYRTCSLGQKSDRR